MFQLNGEKWLNLLRSRVIQNSPNPGWNELWRIKNVPATATLHVTVMDKDEAAVMDDRTGEFNTTVNVGVKEVEIVVSSGPRDLLAEGTSVKNVFQGV